MIKKVKNFDWLKQLNERNYIFEFFAKFSRLEYALKKNKFSKDLHGYVETDFVKFEVSIDEVHINKYIKDFITYLDKEPIRQIELDGTYGIGIKPSGSDVQRLSKHLKKIRNNLFHGSKFPNLPEYMDGSRGDRLIRDGINAIDYLASLNDDVYSTYKG